jgi:ABC-type glutathione transport system ATPase component
VVNAVTENGALVTVSYSASQLGPYTSGAGRLILVVGTQKIVTNLDEAMRRVREHALPYEYARLRETLGVPTKTAKVLIIYTEARPGRTTCCLSKNWWASSAPATALQPYAGSPLNRGHHGAVAQEAGTMTSTAIETTGLTKDYGSGRGLFDLDLVVEEGEVFGYLGPNDAGKTTTIRLWYQRRELRPGCGRDAASGHRQLVATDRLARIGSGPRRSWHRRYRGR